MARTNFENLEVYQLSEKLSDEIWRLIQTWPSFDKFSLGTQMTRSADSIGANIAEGVGRGTYQDNRRFARIARGSLNETQHWLRRAFQRKLLQTEQIEILKPLVDELAPRLNAYINSIGRQITTDNGQRTTDK
ncbi:MAG: four helix bundle protein [Planctomycetaceae bacterium]|nr:four helix bundle protein [Planctomycetaceae bacterium]